MSMENGGVQEGRYRFERGFGVFCEAVGCG